MIGKLRIALNNHFYVCVFQRSQQNLNKFIGGEKKRATNYSPTIGICLFRVIVVLNLTMM